MDTPKHTIKTVNVCAHCLGGICLQKCLENPERINITVQESPAKRQLAPKA